MEAQSLTMNINSPVIEMLDINKLFVSSHVHANKDVTFSVNKGEIHSLVGENGAGKSTVMKILCGLEKADSGKIRVAGRDVKINSTLDADKLGIGMVHQQFCLINEYSIADNIVLMREPTQKLFFYDVKKAKREVRKAAETYGFSLDPDEAVNELTVGEKQRVEILRILYHGSKILILDEPTSLLTQQEVKGFFTILRRLKTSGFTIVLITHKLEEVEEISDRVTIMRDGKVVGTDLMENLNTDKIASMMVGKGVRLNVTKPILSPGEKVLEIKDLDVIDYTCSKHILLGVNLDVRSGEVLGIAGVAGNGLGELEDTITGMLRKDEIHGKILLENKEILGMHPSSLRNLGLAYVPADRLNRGSSLTESLTDNLIVVDHHKFMKWGIQRRRKTASFVKNLIESYSIKGTRGAPIGSLSGGNIQRALLSRELTRDPKLLVISEPTWGLDIMSSEFVYRQVMNMREKGTAILLISSNLDEILSLSDKIAVMYRGEIVGVFENKDLDREFLGAYMLGLKRDCIESGQNT